MTTNSKMNKIEDDDSISVRKLIMIICEWWGYLLSKWIVILIIGILGGSIGFAYAYFKKPTYIATTTFVLEDEKNGSALGGLAGLASMAGVDIGGAGGMFKGDNILELYKSRTMVQRTLLSLVVTDKGKQLLVDRYIEIKKLREAWKKKPELLGVKFVANELGSNPINPNRTRDSLLGVFFTDIITNSLTVSRPDKKLSKIQVDVTSEDEFFSKEFNDILVKNVNEFYVATKTKKASETVKIIQSKTDSVRRVMNGAIYTAVKVADATPNLNPTRQVQRVAPAQKAQFSAETNKTVLSSLIQNLEMSKMALLKETPLIQVVDQPILPLKKVKIGKATALAVGGLIAGLFAVLILVLRKLFKNIMNNA